MSLSIELWKIYEDANLATYAFGSFGLLRNKQAGKVIIFKDSGDVYLIERKDKSLSDETLQNFYLPRVVEVLKYHRIKGLYPKKTEIPTLREEE